MKQLEDISILLPLTRSQIAAASILTCAGLWITGKFYLTVRRRKGLPLPPGPYRLPLVGNMLDMPTSYEWEVVADWGKKYGDLIFTETLGIRALFVNSYEAATELLEKRSATYSTRPPFVLGREIAGWDWNAVLMPYGERLRKQRSFALHFFQPSALPRYYPLQVSLTHKLLKSLVDTPEEFEKHVRHFPGALIMMIAYGYQVQEENDPYIERADAALRYAGHAISSYSIEIFPWLKYMPYWFPGADSIRIAKEGYEISRGMCDVPYAMTKKKFLNGTGVSCMTIDLIESNIDEIGKITDEDDIAGAAGVVYTGGSDTVVTSIITCILAMVLYPDVLSRAQEELDCVVGKDTLPTFEDRPNLPYVDAVCQEALRWEIILPLGVPHYTDEDGIYNGYFIPAKTTIIPNVWAMANDPRNYENPLEFIPERWLSPGQKYSPIPAEKFAFGFVCRLCPGRELALNTLFISVANILACFDIKKATGADGNPITPNRRDAYLANAVRRAVSFPCSITPRSEKTTELIRHSVEAL